MESNGSSNRLSVAVEHTITAGMRTPIVLTANGRQNRKKPVSLLDNECGIASSLCLQDPTIMPAILTAPIAAVHNHTHNGKCITGRIKTAAQMTKIRSATLSIFEPSPLSAFIFLAIGPSIISEMPPQQYSTQNPGLKTGKNIIMIAAMPLDTDSMLGRDLIIMNTPVSSL